MYLIILTIGLCISYFIILFLFTFFFRNQLPIVNKHSLQSVFIIVAGSFVTYAISFNIPDPQLSNRILHVLGGGFLSVGICFLVVKDARLFISRFQFFMFSFLVITAMGVGNEIFEFFLQNYSYFIFSTNPNDTWLDLISNTVGIFIGLIFFVPFITKQIKMFKDGQN